MEVGPRQAMIANRHISIGSNSYEQVKTFKYLGFLVKIKSKFSKK